ncbi:MAG TPA: exodeoxyribonuclease VII large subunit, partial [Firmicutes bacterium]|nr:exodeoxyribonuclease VII large subunit [Bacillota bacterium]
LKFDYDKNLQHIHLKGEISNFKRHSRGHLYFTLKDEEAQISAVMFASSSQKLKFEPRDGMQVILKGHISVYEGGGTYTLYVKEMSQDGIGNLYLAFNELKLKLTQEGLFDQRYKKQIPPYPKAIGVITSPTGAAIRDILSTLKRRYPLAKVYIYPALVQGDQAKLSITKCIQQANEMLLVDTLIVGRGGGSIEDLWPFNEEMVARAIFHSNIPVISAVGHETDFTIADFVADYRAETPTAAAEVAVPNLPDLLNYFSQLNMRLHKNFSMSLELKRKHLLQLSQHYIMKNPMALFEQKVMQLNQLTDKMQYCLQDNTYKNKQRYSMLHQRLFIHNPSAKLNTYSQHLLHVTQNLTYLTHQNIEQNKQQYGILLTKLDMLNPLAVLKKGYSVVTDKEHKSIKSVTQLQTGEMLNLQFDDGKVLAHITEITPNHKRGET